MMEPKASPQVHETALLWALLIGNFVIGTGVMLVPGSLSEIATALQVSVASAGMLITAGAITVCIGAPVFAFLLSRWDRRLLLSLALLWFALLHAACALAPELGSLLVLRVLAMFSAAIFTPQAAAVAGLLVKPERRSQAITMVFLGWSLASVLGAPMAALISGALDWRAAFWLLALLALVSALWVWRVIPSGVKLPAASAALWRATLSSKVMIVTLLVTAFSAAGQFSVFAYFSPYVVQQLSGSASDVALLFAVFGVFGVLGSFAVSRVIGRIGPPQAVMATLLLMALSLLLWPLGSSIVTLALVCIPWGLGCFSSNSAQQARLVALAPPMAGVTIAVNTSALYLGQGMGSAVGGLIVQHGGMAHLHWAGLAGLLLAVLFSVWAQRWAARQKA